jgi:hypothetical protein
MKRSVVVVLVLGLLVQRSSSVKAQEFIVYGPITDGTPVSCGAFTNFEKGSVQRQTYDWWVFGYVTGAGNILDRHQVGLARTDLNGLRGWMATYCTDHPLDTLIMAAIHLVDELQARGKK